MELADSLSLVDHQDFHRHHLRRRVGGRVGVVLVSASTCRSVCNRQRCLIMPERRSAEVKGKCKRLSLKWRNRQNKVKRTVLDHPHHHLHSPSYSTLSRSPLSDLLLRHHPAFGVVDLCLSPWGFALAGRWLRLNGRARRTMSNLTRCSIRRTLGVCDICSRLFNLVSKVVLYVYIRPEEQRDRKEGHHIIPQLRLCSFHEIRCDEQHG